MAIISCPECGKQVSDRAVSCPNCGFPISAAPPVVSQVDTAKEIEKLIGLARRAREASDSKNAKRYYDQIMDKDPGNWEAIFFSVYFEATECKIIQIASAANCVANCIYSTFSAIADLESKAEKEEALNCVVFSAMTISIVFIDSAVGHYNQYSTLDGAFSECSGRVVAAGNIYAEIEKSLKAVFPEMKARLADFQKNYLQFMREFSSWYNDSYLQQTCSRLDREIGEFSPQYRKKTDILCRVAAIDAEINGLVTERKAVSMGTGVLLVACGIFALIGAGMLSDLGFGTEFFLSAIVMFVVSAFCFRQKPSGEVVEANKKRKQELTNERKELMRELNSKKK